MTERTRNIFVGLTALAGLAAMAWLIIVFGEVPAWVEKSYPIQIYLDNANGLSAGSRVKLSGIDVGSISEIGFADPEKPGGRIRATCSIDAKYAIPSEAAVRAQASLFGGGANIQINPQPVEGDRGYLPTDGSGALKGRASSLGRQIQNLSDNLGQELDTQLKNFGQLSKKMTELSEQYIVVGQQVSRMLEPRPPEAVDEGKAEANLMTAIARADARLAEMKSTIGQINELVGDEELRSDLRAAAKNAREVTEDAKELTGSARKQLDRLVSRYIAVADDLSGTMDRADSVLAEVQAGEGTIGRLAKDPALYNSITDAANRLSDLVRETKLLIQKWKAEGVPVQF